MILETVEGEITGSSGRIGFTAANRLAEQYRVVGFDREGPPHPPLPGEEPFIKPWMINLADDHYALDISRARTLLGWEPQRSLHGALAKMVAALQADPLGWYQENKLEPPAWLEAIAAQPTGEEAVPMQHQEQSPAAAESEHAGMAEEHHDPIEMTRRMREPWLWTNSIIIALGVWLMTSPATFGYRSAAMSWSDLISGALLILFGALSLAARSDAGLGAVAYTIEALMAYMGGTSRWRTMPWMVTFFGILVVPLGIVHILLVISMPVVVGYWCFLCLAAATVMLVMIPLTVDEVVAMIQFMVRSVREGKLFWHTFWVGGTLEGEVNEDTRTPRYGVPVGALAKAGVWGVTLPWTLAISAALDVWLMFAPSFGPGLLMALIAVLVLWRQLPPSGDQPPGVARTRLETVPDPPRSATDPAWLLEQREALRLSARQLQKLSRLRARWVRDTQSLRTATVHASIEFDRGIASRDRRSFTLQELQDRAAPVSEFSRQLVAARRAWWDQAATILTAAQRQRAEEVWAQRLTPRIRLESDSRR